MKRVKVTPETEIECNGVVMTPKQIGAVTTAYTMIMVGDFTAMTDYVNGKIGREVSAHELATDKVAHDLKHLCRDDMLAVSQWCGCNVRNIEDAKGKKV